MDSTLDSHYWKEPFYTDPLLTKIYADYCSKSNNPKDTLSTLDFYIDKASDPKIEILGFRLEYGSEMLTNELTMVKTEIYKKYGTKIPKKHEPEISKKYEPIARSFFTLSDTYAIRVFQKVKDSNPEDLTDADRSRSAVSLYDFSNVLYDFSEVLYDFSEVLYASKDRLQRLNDFKRHERLVIKICDFLIDHEEFFPQQSKDKQTHQREIKQKTDHINFIRNRVSSMDTMRNNIKDDADYTAVKDAFRRAGIIN